MMQGVGYQFLALFSRGTPLLIAVFPMIGFLLNTNVHSLVHTIQAHINAIYPIAPFKSNHLHNYPALYENLEGEVPLQSPARP